MDSRVVSTLLIAFAILVPLQRIAGPANTIVADLAAVSLVLYTWSTLWRTRKPVSFPLILPQWLILVASLMATLVSLDRGGSLKAIAGDLYVYVWFVTLCNAIEDEEIVSKVGKVWVVVACIEAFLVLLGYAGLGPRSAALPKGARQTPGVKREAIGTFDLAVWSGRAMGTFFNPNATAAYLGVSFFLFLATAFPHNRALRWGIGIWLLAGILATGSNAGLAGLAAGVFFMILLRSQHKAAMAWISATVIITALVTSVFLMSGTSLEALGESTRDSTPLRLTLGRLEDGIDGRLTLLREGWKAYLTAPLGLGPLASREIGTTSRGLHNEYAGYLFERGILALLGLLLMMAEVLSCVGSSARLTQVGSVRRCQLASFVGVCISVVVTALSHEVLHFRDFWFVLALMFAQNRLLKREHGSGQMQLVSSGAGHRA